MIISFPHGNQFIHHFILPGNYFIQYFIPSRQPAHSIFHSLMATYSFKVSFSLAIISFNISFVSTYISIATSFPHGNFIILTWFCSFFPVFISLNISFLLAYISIGVQHTFPNMGIVAILNKNSNTQGEIWKIDDWCDVEGYCCQGPVCIFKYGNDNISR